MTNLFNGITSAIGINDIVDILVVAFVIYKILGFIRQSRAEQLVKGLLIILVATLLSDILKLYTLNWILKSSLAVGVIALVIVFQPELRRGLESLGRSKIIKNRFSNNVDKNGAEIIADKIGVAIGNMSTNNVGALIVIERETALTDIGETGIKIDGQISSELIENIFYEGSPLHDGAIILRGDRIYCAGCVLPLTQNTSLPSELGTRHRAAIGITEHSDCVSLVVSEESGIISIAINGKLTRRFSEESLKNKLVDIYTDADKERNFPNIKNIFGRIGGSKDAPK